MSLQERADAVAALGSRSEDVGAELRHPGSLDVLQLSGDDFLVADECDVICGPMAATYTGGATQPGTLTRPRVVTVSPVVSASSPASSCRAGLRCAEAGGAGRSWSGAAKKRPRIVW